jgi:S1-C subfamily serine protease
MMARLREHQPGDRVKITLRRDGKEETVTVTLKASQPRE